jgi:hypothetical protein
MIGISTKKITTKIASRAAVAAALSLGLTIGAVGVASASTVSHSSSSHSGHKSNQSGNRVEGIVSAYVAGTSISITSKGATTPTVYTLTSATVINGLAAGATLASPANVDLVPSTTAPTTVTSIFVEANGEGNGHGNGNCGSTTSGTRQGGFSRHGSHGFGSSKHGGDRR